MSCLRPLTIYNSQKRFTVDGGHRFLLSVPCGQCSECKKAKNNEWFFRAYYEASSCIGNKGFVYFDTLTYSNKCLPHLHNHVKDIPFLLDQPCFNRDDLRKFFLRLRIFLSRRGYDIANNLRYFLSSEYGEDNNRTHRPHYHILLFSNVPDLDVLTLSRAISDNWHFGRTDGEKYKGAQYVFNHTIKDLDSVHMQNICKYVTKYVMKDSAFDDEIDKRIAKVLEHRNLDPKSFEGREFARELKRNASNFHLQSKGFGSDFLKYNDYNDVIENGIIRCPDSVTTLRMIPLPTYYRRKLFYDLVKDFRGKRCWKLNQLGIRLKYRDVEQNIHRLAVRFSDWNTNLSTYVGNDDYQRVNDIVNGYLGNRSWSDFATYIALFRGTVKPFNVNGSEPPTLDYWLSSLYEPTENTKYYYSYVNMYDRHHFGMPFFYDSYLGSSTDGYRPLLIGEKLRLDDFCKEYLIDENTYKEFNDFDKLFELYCMTLVRHNEARNGAFNEIERLKKLYKSFNY